jgi:acetolactate synthase-1/2/3 large subunit
MDIFSADLPVDAFKKMPAEVARPTIDRMTAERIVGALTAAERPVLYAGGGVLSARASGELAALAEALELPVAHTLMGKGVLHEQHPLLLGQSGFWGTPIANEKLREADLILAIGTRLAEANSSSWDPRFTFTIPPTRLMHIDADVAEIGRNFPTELGAVADAKLALAALVDAARGRRAFADNWSAQYASDQYPMRPERILNELRRAVPEDGYIVTDVGWNKNGVGQQFPITVPGTFITPSGLATMGFGPAAALGVKLAHPERAVVALIGDGAFGSNPSVVATAMEQGIGVVWLVMDNAAFGTIAGLTKMHYGWEFGCLFERDGEPYRTDFAQIARGYGADAVFIRAADELGPALDQALASGRPTVIQAPMENVPTPTPGHWDINCVYRKGS